MLQFMNNLIRPEAVIVLAIWVFFLFSLVWNGFPALYTGPQGRTYGTIIPFICFLVVVVVAFIAWARLVF